eukprot:TRINITY_DN3479_c0_g1_i1.p1 TRINITY_DN3479_c0_g1~~TRINITY_DN3479_c0_g1_i1.p1  ORF type:complete len:263 (-),score=65.87 TRINITY_DN3479_c0_g1_i1:190-978(-)
MRKSHGSPLSGKSSRRNLQVDLSQSSPVVSPSTVRLQSRTNEEEPVVEEDDFERDNEEEEEESNQKASTPSKGWWGLGSFTKNLVSKVVVSKMGKKFLKDWVSPDGIAFLVAIRDIIAKQLNNQKEADVFEQIALKTFTDIILLITNKTLAKERVLLIRDSIFLLWSDALDMLEISFIFDDIRLLNSMNTCWDSVNMIILPHVELDKKDHIDKFSSILLDQKFVSEFYNDDKWSNEREKLKTILRRVWDNTFSTITTTTTNR